MPPQSKSVINGRINAYTAVTSIEPPDNYPPVLDPIGNKSIGVGETLEFTVTASDKDEDPLEFSAAPLPEGATFESQVFSWIPLLEQVGSHYVTFSVTDGEFSDFEEICINVTAPPPPPTFWVDEFWMEQKGKPNLMLYLSIVENRHINDLPVELVIEITKDGELISTIVDATNPNNQNFRTKDYVVGAGTYVATIVSLSRDGYVWDKEAGVPIFDEIIVNVK
jgi:hypothetical protein